MLAYETLKKKPRQLLALTSLARREFEELLPAFGQALADAETQRTSQPEKRQRARG